MKRSSRDDDRGQVTSFAIAILLGLWLFAGLVVDGGLALAGKVRALDIAQEAARTGAQEVDLVELRAHHVVRLDPRRARRAAAAYVTTTGNIATVRVSGNEVRVRVTHRQRTQILRLVGVSKLVTSASASVQAQHGTSMPEHDPLRKHQ